MFVRNFPLQNELPADGAASGGGAGPADGGGGGGGSSGESFNLEAAVNEVGAGLGFGENNNERTDDGAAPVDGGGERAPAPSPAPSPAPTAAPAATSAPVGTPSPSPAPSRTGAPPDITKAPDTWTAAAKAKWDGIDPELKAEIHRREQSIWTGIESYKAEATFAKSVKSALGPAYQALQQANFPPEQFIKNLSDTHMILSDQRVPVAERRAIAVRALAQYGIDLTKPAEGGEEEFIDPQVKSLREEVNTLKSTLTAQAQRDANQVRETLSKEIEEFAGKNPLFYEVADDIAILIKGSGGQMKLQDAFERAVRANPVTFAKEQARIEAEAVAKARKAEEDRVAAAKRASSANVKSGGHQGQGGTAAATGSWDDTMEATLKEIKGRS